MGINKYGVKRIKNALSNNKGTTMVETLVCFIVLALVLAGLYSMVKFSSELRMKAVDTGNLTKEFGSLIYTNSPEENGEIEKYEYFGKSSDTKNTAFMLKLNMTDEEIKKNYYGGDDSVSISSGMREKLETAVRLPNFDAVAYVSSSPLATKYDGEGNPIDSYEGIVAPKVIEFDYHSETD